MTNKAIWLNQMHASQRDVAQLIREGSSGDINVVSSHGSYREDIFMTADHFFMEPSAEFLDSQAQDAVNRIDYERWALNIAENIKVDCMLAMRYRKRLISVRDKFSALGIRLAAGTMEADMIDLCDHKDKFTEVMKAAGLPVIKTVAVDNADELKNAIAEISASGTEVCIKPAVGVYGRGFWRFVPGMDRFTLFSTLEANEVDPDVYIEAYAKSEGRARMIVMQYLPGIESSVDCVCDDGQIVAHAIRQKSHDRQTVSTGGPELEVAQAAARELRLDGLVNVQTKADANGRPLLLEVNTRPSGGVGYSAVAGVNLPHACAQMMLGDKVTNTSLSYPVVIRRTDLTYVLSEATKNLRERAA